MTYPPQTIAKFLDQVEISDGCWQWLGNIGTNGYGAFNAPRPSTRSAHRLAYLILVGPIPEGMVLDHLCQNRWCVRPNHLDVVDAAENTRRGNEMRAWKGQIRFYLKTGQWLSRLSRWYRGREEKGA